MPINGDSSVVRLSPSDPFPYMDAKVLKYLFEIEIIQLLFEVEL